MISDCLRTGLRVEVFPIADAIASQSTWTVWRWRKQWDGHTTTYLEDERNDEAFIVRGFLGVGCRLRCVTDVDGRFCLWSGVREFETRLTGRHLLGNGRHLRGVVYASS